MPFQSVPNTCEIILRFTANGQEMINTHYGHMDTAYSIADLEALATAVDTAVHDHMLLTLPPQTRYVRTDVRGLNSAIDLAASAEAGAGLGTAASDGAPNNVTLAVKRASGFTGRGARGRVFWPSIPAGIVDSGDVVTAPFQTAVLAALDEIDAAISASGFVPVIVHRVAAGVPLVPAVVFTIVEWTVVNAVVDSMRRRLPGRGV